MALGAAPNPNLVVAPANVPNPSLPFGTLPFGPGVDPKGEGLPLRAILKAEGDGDDAPKLEPGDAALRNGDGFDAKAANPLKLVVLVLGGGEVVLEGDLGVEYLEKRAEGALNAEKPEAAC